MLKSFGAILILLTTLPTLGAPCWELYKEEEKKIDQEGAHSVYVGGRFYQHSGQIFYDPGIKVSGPVDNWARDFNDAIKWGPASGYFAKKNQRQDWLEELQSAIENDCSSKNEDFESLRAMLSELMEDGSLCPEGKIIRPKLFGRKTDFKKILRQSIKDNKFTHLCQGPSVVDDSDRSIKNQPSEERQFKKERKSSQQ